MLSLWLDFGTSLAEMEKDRDRTREKVEIIHSMKKSLEKMTKIIGKHIEFCFKQYRCVVL
jgi:Ethanolamine utilization protein EutJ (predicted chaperonin)